MAYLLDTNHCIYLINGLEKRPERRKPEETNVIRSILSLTDPKVYFSEATLGELYFGVARSEKKAQGLEKIAFLKRLFEPIRVDEGIWRQFGETLSELRRAGTPLSDRDLLIACTAKVRNHTLVTNDSDFDLLPDGFVTCGNWAKPMNS